MAAEAVAASSEDDPVISEVDVYLSQSLAKHLYLFQFSLRPSHLLYSSQDVVGVRVKEGLGRVEVDVGIVPRGENYSTSRGEHFARMVELSRAADATEPHHYQSGMMDKQTLASNSPPLRNSRYVTAVFKDGELHVTPLCGVVQLRPSHAHLDHADVGGGRPGVGVVGCVATSEGETTESEGEEAKPVTVRFARPDKGNSNRPGHKLSFQQQAQQQAEEAWLSLAFHDMLSEEATSERQLLFAPEEDRKEVFHMAPAGYLDLVCPVEGPQENPIPATPTGTVSLSQIKTMPLPQQVRELLRSGCVMPFSRLCLLLGGRSLAEPILQAVQWCGVLVQGCWVVESEVVYPGDGDRALRNARDYILWCFTRSRQVVRKDIAAVTKIHHEDLRDLLLSVATQRVALGWEFKLATDHEFLSKYPLIVQQQQEKWTRRYRELMVELNISKETGKQCQAKHQKQSTASAQAAVVVSGGELVRVAEKKAKALTQGLQERATHPHSLTVHIPPSSLTPVPMDIDRSAVALETQLSTPTSKAMLPAPPIKPEEPSQELIDALGVFCHHALGRGVVGFSEIRDKLLLRCAGASEGDPLWSHGVPDSLLEGVLARVGALEVGQPWGRRIFALEGTGDLSDKYRSVVLRLFQCHKGLRRRQLVEEITRQLGEQPDNRALSSVLKELCHSRGSMWYLMGT